MTTMELGKIEAIVTFEEKSSNHSHASVVIEPPIAKKLMDDFWVNVRKTLKPRKGFRRPDRKMVEREEGKGNIYAMPFSMYANANIMRKAPRRIIMTGEHEINQEIGDLDDRFIVTCDVWFEPEVQVKAELDEIKDVIIEIPDFDVEKYVEAKINGFALLNPILHNKVDDEGNAQESEPWDMVEVGIECLVDGERYEDACEEATNLRLIEGHVKPQSLYDKLIGLKPGDSFQINSDDLPPAFSEELAGKTMELSVTVNRVYWCEKAEVNDDLAMTANFKSLIEWQNHIRDSGKRVKQMDDDMRRRTGVMRHLASKVEFSGLIPDSWVEAKLKEFKLKDTPKSRNEVRQVAVDTIIVKAVGEKIGVEWDDADKEPIERDEEAYANKVIDFILLGAEIKYVEFDPETATA